VELSRRLAEEAGLGIVWVGGRGDGELLRYVRSRSRPGAVAAAGLSLEGLAALLGRASVFVGNDSGPMHLAGAAGTALVGIFGPGDPSRLLPRSRRAEAVRGLDGRGRPDVRQVSVEEVLGAVRRVLAERPGP
jgi:ADP-heptose:LPS heptosyltransferase